MGFFWSFSRFAVKTALVAGAIKLSIDNDIWSLNTTNGADLYEKLRKYIVPGTIVYPEQLPSVEEVTTDIERVWNKGVDKVFTTLQHAPSNLNTAANRMINNK
ncbi:hypothetical protein ANCDUO_24886 [Ancylostoma duodenale]|uniref:MICOS complex subunit MIC13 n=1 Tax=Ancylostoma duodenale TaxID=51022 RepID=A0A0C2FEG5_9BILA|nr:hypothetical protein ANCDUO_24886 [Ancylostoma duodenale]